MVNYWIVYLKLVDFTVYNLYFNKPNLKNSLYGKILLQVIGQSGIM